MTQDQQHEADDDTDDMKVDAADRRYKKRPVVLFPKTEPHTVIKR